METIFVINAILILLIPFSAILSQFIGKHKKITGSRVSASLISIISCIAMLTLLILGWLFFRDSFFYVMIPAALLMNWGVIWLQRENLRANKMRKGINICILLADIACLIFVAFSLFSSYNEFNNATDGHWNSTFDGSESQEERNAHYPASSFERDFGFSFPSYDVIEMDYSSAGYGIGGYVVTVRTEKNVPNEFFKKQVSANVMNWDYISYKDGVFYGREDQSEYKITRKKGNLWLIEVMSHG